MVAGTRLPAPSILGVAYRLLTAVETSPLQANKLGVVIGSRDGVFDNSIA